MASCKKLCRLCAKQHEFNKDLLDANNKSILDIVRQYTKISVTHDDFMPTIICLDCEEKMVSFQLFLLECCKVQDLLASIICNTECDIKTEDTYPLLDIKSEVNIELTTHNNEVIGGSDFIVGLFPLNDDVNDDNNDVNNHNDDVNNHNDDVNNHNDDVNNFNDDVNNYKDDVNNDNDDSNDDDDDDDLDNITIAALKRIKEKKEVPSEEQMARLSKVLATNFKLQDLVALNCLVCVEKKKNWAELRSHCVKKHKCKPIVECLCGFVIKSSSVLSNHVTEHKMQAKKKIIKLKFGSYHKANEFIEFKCVTCGKEYTSWYTLKKHCVRLHKVPPVVACKCGLVMKSKTVMYNHVQYHRKPNVSELACDQCTVVAKSLAALEKHKMRHVPKAERKFVCSLVDCRKVFHTKDLLKSHEKSHIPIESRKVFQCESCYVKFTTRSSLVSHVRVVHEKIKSYVCDLCGYACGTNGELRQHRAIHSEDKPYVCKTCSKSFKTYSNLKTHEDTHGDTSYVCYVCNRVLNSRRTLRKHLLVHEEKFRHVCSYCNKAFKRRQTLKVHMCTHTGDKPQSCKWCDERFAYASTLRSHRQRCHPDKVAQASLSDNYRQPYIPTQSEQQEYIKADIAAIQCSETKNEVEVL